MKSKWQLASMPYSVGNLFGQALEPLIETRDRRKILPSASRQGDSRYSASPRYQSFRGPDSGSFQPRFQRSFSSRSQQDSQVRQGSRFQAKHPSRGGRGHFTKSSDRDLSEPPIGGHLSLFYTQWELSTNDSWVLHTIHSGFSLEFHSLLPPVFLQCPISHDRSK